MPFAETEARIPAEPVPSTSSGERSDQDHMPSSSSNDMPFHGAWQPAIHNEVPPYQLQQINMPPRPSTSSIWQPCDFMGNAGDQRNNSGPQSSGEWRPPRQKYSCPDSFRDPRAKKRSFLSRVMSSSSSDDSDDFSLRYFLFLLPNNRTWLCSNAGHEGFKN